MTNHAQRECAPGRQSDLFGDPQGDLFGPAAAPAYQPRPEHVRNALKKLVGEMQAASHWPWPQSVVSRNRDHWLEHLCTLLPDAAEADDWRARIKAQIARLDAAQNALKAS